MRLDPRLTTDGKFQKPALNPAYDFIVTVVSGKAGTTFILTIHEQKTEQVCPGAIYSSEIVQLIKRDHGYYKESSNIFRSPVSHWH